MRCILSSALVALTLTTGAAWAQSPVPPDQLRLKDERVLETPYWWAWRSTDDDVKRPLNVLTEADAQRMIKAYGEPYQAFFAARADMFYEPGTIITQVFTTTVYVRLPELQEHNSEISYIPPNGQVRVDVLYLSTTFSIRETVTNTIRYRPPYEQVGSLSVVASDSPYAKYRFVVEDYAGDRIVGVNVGPDGRVTECALIARAVLERPITVWTLPGLPMNNSDRYIIYRHTRDNLYRVEYGVVVRPYSTKFVFETTRLRPIFAQHGIPLPNNQNNMFISWSSRFAYDQPIPDFLVSPACRSNRAVQSGVPSELDALFGGQVPGTVRIAHLTPDAREQVTHLRFSLVVDQPLDQAADLVKARVERALGTTVPAALVKREKLYNLPSVSFVLPFAPNRSKFALRVDAIGLDQGKTLVRGWLTQ